MRNQTPEAYYYKKSEDLYFTMVKVTDLNRGFWHHYRDSLASSEIRNQLLERAIYIESHNAKIESADQKLEEINAKIVTSIANGMAGFSILDNQPPGFEQWVVMASCLPIQSCSLYDIEMTMMVSTADNVGFTVHMGMFRTYHSILRASLLSRPLHKNIAADMHAVAATLMQTIYPTKQWMVNSPMPHMRATLEKELGNDQVKCVEEKRDANNKKTIVLPSSQFVMKRDDDRYSWFFEYPNLGVGLLDIIEINLKQLSKLCPIDNIIHVEQDIRPTISPSKATLFSLNANSCFIIASILTAFVICIHFDIKALCKKIIFSCINDAVLSR